ncbi:MAG: hypothetical protein ACLQQB_04280 [Solirubrobacteraceae bacterium]
MGVKLERRPEGCYFEPITGTTIRRITGYGSARGEAETVWELETGASDDEGGVTIARTLTNAKSFLGPLVRLVVEERAKESPGS